MKPWIKLTKLFEMPFTQFFKVNNDKKCVLELRTCNKDKKK